MENNDSQSSQTNVEADYDKGDINDVVESDRTNNTNVSNGNTTAIGTDSSPKTGDSSSFILFITLGIISLGVSVYLYYLSRKCEE